MPPGGVIGVDRVRTGTLPAGRYLSATPVGPYDRFQQATAQFLAWALDNGHAFDVESTNAGERWAARLELYPTTPSVEPDARTWETVLCFRLRQ